METKDVAKEFADAVRRLMAEQEPPWNQNVLAERLGWSQGNVSRMLTCKRAPSAIVIAQLATAFGVDLCGMFCPAKGKKKAKPADAA